MWPDWGAAGGSRHLHNFGAPATRQRVEKVSADFLHNAGKAHTTGYFRLCVPVGAELLPWLEAELERAGFSSWAEADAALPRPQQRALAYDRKEGQDHTGHPPRMNIAAALVLGRCKQHYYQPDGPLILTRKRLLREVRLATIHIKEYYDLD